MRNRGGFLFHLFTFWVISSSFVYGQVAMQSSVIARAEAAPFSDVAAESKSPYRVVITSQPQQITARYPSLFQIQVTEPLDSADPLLGSEAPASCQVSVEIRSADGIHLLAGPLLIPPQAEQAEVFALSYRFESAGDYLLGLNLHGVDGETFWHPTTVQVMQDPYVWLDTGFWILFAVLAVWVLTWSWKRGAAGLQKRVKALAISFVFLLLAGLLLLQFLAPSARHYLWRNSWVEDPWSLEFTDAGADPVTGIPVETVSLAAEGQPYSGMAKFPALESGRPEVLTVSLKGENSGVLRGIVSGYLQPVGGEAKTVGVMDPSTHDHAAMLEMASPAAAKMLSLDFRESQAGVYQTTLLPGGGGAYRLRLNVQAHPQHLTLQGSRAITIGTPSGMTQMAMGFDSGLTSGRFLAAGILLALLGASTLWLLSLRSKWKEHPRTFDLFRWKPLYSFVRWKYFQLTLWIPNLIVFSLVIYLGIWDTQVGGQNLATKLTWTIWWAAIIFAFVFLGKIWCAMCPFGALTIWTSRIFSPQRRLPRMLRNIWIANLAFFFVTWADDFWGIVSTPRYTALLVIIISLSAMAIGFFFERATFCRHLCPIGGLIGIYSMFSGLELRARDREICRLCKGKECYAGTAELPGCPMIQFPATLDRNNYCNLCGDCVKTCPYDNLTLQIRPFAQDIWSSWRRHWDEAFLAIALVGLTVVVTGHMIEPWHDWMDAMTAWIPWQTLGIYDHETVEKWSFSLIYIAAILIVAPLLLLGSSGLATRWAPGKASLNSTFRTYAYMFIPVGIGLHLAHNLLHLLKEGLGIVPVLQRTVTKYTPFNLGIPNWNVPLIVPDVAIYWLQMGTLVLFYAASIYLGYRIALRSCPDRATAVRTIVPMVVLSLGFTLFNIFLLSQPMAARHHH